MLAEGLAAGLPVVASDLAGYRAVLEEGALGRLVPPGDASALAQELGEVLEDEDVRRQLSARGVEAAVDLDWERVADQVLAVYGQAMEKGSARKGAPLPWI